MRPPSRLLTIARLTVALGLVLFAAGGGAHRDALVLVGTLLAGVGGLGVLVAIGWGG